MKIDPKMLDPETLNNLVSSYVLQEGTDYGEQETALEVKVAQVIKQLKTGEAILVYSELHESVNIMPADAYQSAQIEEHGSIEE